MEQRDCLKCFQQTLESWWTESADQMLTTHCWSTSGYWSTSHCPHSTCVVVNFLESLNSHSGLSMWIWSQSLIRWIDNRYGCTSADLVFRKGQLVWCRNCTRIHVTVLGLMSCAVTGSMDSHEGSCSANPLTHSHSPKILRVPYTSHVTNAYVRETTGCPPISTIIKTTRLRLRGTFGFQTRSSSSYRSVAPTTKRLEETSRVPAYHLAERDWCRCTVGKHQYPLSLEEGQRCSLATYHRHDNTPLGARQ